MEHRRAESTVVNRDLEFAVFKRAAVAAGEGSSSTLLVAGEAGMGKSTLLAEAARRTKILAYLGRCVHVGGDPIPLAPLVDLVRSVRRHPPPGGADVGTVAGLAELASAFRAAPEATRRGDVLELALDLAAGLGAAAPVLIAFEDLHWGDAASWDMFEFLARNLVEERVVLVGTYRPDEVARQPTLRRRVAELGCLPETERIVLSGLDRPSVAMHAAAVLGVPPPPALVEELLRRGEGNPFFTEQLVAAYLAGEAIPPLLSELLEADLAAVSPAGRHVVGAVAAVGRHTEPRLLAAIVELDEARTEAAVREALDARLLAVDAFSDSYVVRHPLIGEVAYAALLPSERQRVHRAIAEALRVFPPLRLTRTDAAGELAFHLDRAGDEAGAFAAALEAADVAEGISPAACLAHLERALELWDAHAPPERAGEHDARLWQAAELASATGDNRRAIERASRALALGDPPLGRAWAHERLGRFLWAEGRLEASAAEYLKAAELAEANGDGDAKTAHVFAGLAQAELMFRRFDEAERWARRALSPVARDEEATWSTAVRVLGLVDVVAGRLEDGVERCRDAVDATQVPHRRALATTYLVIALLDAGRTEEAVTVALDSAPEAQRAGFETSFGAYLTGLAAEGLMRLGRWRDADNVLEAAAGLESMPIAAIVQAAPAATLAARRGDLDLAIRLLDRLATQPSDPWHDVIGWAAQAEVALAAHMWDDAVAVAERALKEDGTRRRWIPKFTALLVTGMVERTLDAVARREPVEVEGVARHLDDLIRQARAHLASRGPVADAYLAEASAVASRLTGTDLDAAAQAAKAADRLRDPWITARARLLEADAAATGGAAARAADALRAAFEIATRLGAQPLRDEVEALSRRARIGLETAATPTLDRGGAARLGLTPREAEVLALVAAGRTNREIGSELYVSEKTASVHISNILRKLGVRTRVEAAAVAQRLDIT